MNKIEVNNEMFIIDGKPIYLYGGEFHYFRVPASEWEDRIIKMKEAGINLISTYIPWIFHERVEGEIDLIGKSRPEKDLKSFIELVGKHGMYCFVRPGPYIMAETKNEGVPLWVNKNYPEVIGKKRDGSNHLVVTYLHPKFLEKTKIWYKAVCDIVTPLQITKGGPVILFQLDNEIGMLHWVMTQPDFSPIVLDYFAKYLETSYTIEELNSRYETTYNTIVEFAYDAIKIEEQSGMKFHHDYGNFLREYHREYVKVLKQYSNEFGITVPFIVNIHGFGEYNLIRRGNRYPTGISQLYKTTQLDDVYLAGDYYMNNVEFDSYQDLIMANAFTKAAQPKNQPLFSAEFQSGMLNDKPKIQPSSHEFVARTSIAHGLKSLNYYMFVGGENYEGIGGFGKYHDWQAPLSNMGERQHHYFIYQRIGKMLQVIGSNLLQANPKIDTTIAFNPDYYMVETMNKTSAPIYNPMAHIRDRNLIDGIFKWMANDNYSVDSINVLDDELDVVNTPTLWMYSSEHLNKKVQIKLVDYIKKGGKLVLFPSIPMKDIDGSICTLLKDYIDVTIEGHSRRDFVTINQKDSNMVENVEYYDVKNAEVIAMSDEDKRIVSFMKNIDLGTVIVFGASLHYPFRYLSHAYNFIASLIGVSPKVVKSSDLEIVIREHGKQKFVFINNYDTYDQETTIIYHNEPLFGGMSIKVPARSGVTYLVDYELAPDFYIDYATCEVIEFNDEYMLVRCVEEESVIKFQSTRVLHGNQLVKVNENEIIVQANPFDLVKIYFQNK